MTYQACGVRSTFDAKLESENIAIIIVLSSGLKKQRNPSFFCFAYLMCLFSSTVAFVFGFTICDATENPKLRSGRPTAAMYTPLALCAVNSDDLMFVSATSSRWCR